MNVAFNKNKVKVPESWDELCKNDQRARRFTDRKLPHIYSIFMLDTGEWLLPEEKAPFLKIAATKTLLGWNDNMLTEWEIDCIENHGPNEGREVFLEELKELCDKVCSGFLETKEVDGANHTEISLSLSEPPFPFFKQQSKISKVAKKWYPPSANFMNMSIYELGVVFDLFEAWLESKDPDTADELIATIYRPQKPQTKANLASGYEGDIREPLRKFESQVVKRQQQIHRYNPLVKQLIIFWIASCRNYIVSTFKDLFDSKQSHGSGPSFGWAGTLLSLADGIKDLDIVSDTKAITVFIYLRKLNADQQRRELEYSKSKR